jgi:nanoRNase/pAp phosphatase (c-di-AMP/oligoRNAs hydrolase)
MMDDINQQNPIDKDKLTALRTAVGHGPVLILTHNNPDPDSLASGAALSTLLKEAWGIPNQLVYTGLVARAENRAVLHNLTPAWEHSETLTDFEEYSALALVDTQPGAGNNSLPGSFVPHIVIDHHHPLREALKAVPYSHVRPDVGATVTLLYQYLDAAGIVPDSALATAMFYGLKTDTRGLSRGASPEDEAVYIELLSLIDRRELIRIEQAGLPREYFSAFSQGLQAARIFGQAIVAYLGPMHRPDLAAEMADLLIRLESARAVLCLGTHDQLLHLSLRTEPLGQDAGLLIQKVVIPPGKAGGHGTMAGGQVPLDDQKINYLVGEIERRFLKALGETGHYEPLLVESMYGNY